MGLPAAEPGAEELADQANRRPDEHREAARLDRRHAGGSRSTSSRQHRDDCCGTDEEGRPIAVEDQQVRRCQVCRERADGRQRQIEYRDSSEFEARTIDSRQQLGADEERENDEWDESKQADRAQPLDLSAQEESSVRLDRKSVV